MSAVSILRVYDPADWRIPWAAGFIDGEGSVGIKQRSDRTGYGTVYLSAPQVRREPLDRLAEMFGGSSRLRRSQRAGWRDLWVWEIGGARRVGPVLTALIPFLTVKREEAEIVMRFIERVGADGWSRRGLSEDEKVARQLLMDELISHRRPDMKRRMTAARAVQQTLDVAPVRREGRRELRCVCGRPGCHYRHARCDCGGLRRREKAMCWDCYMDQPTEARSRRGTR